MRIPTIAPLKFLFSSFPKRDPELVFQLYSQVLLSSQVISSSQQGCEEGSARCRKPLALARDQVLLGALGAVILLARASHSGRPTWRGIHDLGTVSTETRGQAGSCSLSEKKRDIYGDPGPSLNTFPLSHMREAFQPLLSRPQGHFKAQVMGVTPIRSTDGPVGFAKVPLQFCIDAACLGMVVLLQTCLPGPQHEGL